MTFLENPRRYNVRRHFRVSCGLFAAIYGIILFGVRFGLWIVDFLPGVGGFFFLTSLQLQDLAGRIFDSSTFFAFNEFGGHPAGFGGYLVMAAFYAAVAGIVAIPFAFRRSR